MILHVALALATVVARPPKPVHKFYDRPAKIELTVAIGAAAFDMAQTCHNLANGGREQFMTQSCAKNNLIEAGLLGAQELAAYTLHRTGHHKLERLVRLYSTVDSTIGIVYSKQHGAW